MKTLAAFVRLPASTRRMALEAALLLFAARLLVDHVPMRWWRHRLHIAPASPPGAARTSQGAADAVRIGCIVRKVARRSPFAARCLVQAMATQWMLRRRGVASRLVFGVRRGAAPDGALEFHAWVSTAGGQVVIGGAGIETYAPLNALESTLCEAGDGQRHPRGTARRGR